MKIRFYCYKNSFALNNRFRVRTDIDKHYKTWTVTFTGQGTSKQSNVKKLTLNKKLNDDMGTLKNDNDFEQQRETAKLSHTDSEEKKFVVIKNRFGVLRNSEQ